jgi:dipeptidyl aminopeptidase/acylaminoacyl peptidase
VHVRGARGVGMLLRRGGRVAKVDTRTKYNRSPAAYSSWHPSGRFVTFSVNKLRMFYHDAGETRHVFDAASDLGCYWPASNAVKSSRHLTDPAQLETFPNWSPDGRCLYFCRAPKVPFHRYRQIRYDLMRIGYDPDTDTWGEPEVVLSAKETARSAAEPRVSPDGRYVMFCLFDYGSFPVYQPSSDLYVMDVEGGWFRKLSVNSPRSESWHCWSSNGRWFVFSSKRRDGIFAKPYLSYFDRNGRAHKPFVLPQRDPDFYESHLRTYNVPELVSEAVPLGPRDFARAVLAPSDAHSAEAVSGATPKPPVVED